MASLVQFRLASALTASASPRCLPRLGLAQRPSMMCRSSKGFGSQTKQAEGEASGADSNGNIDDLEAQIKSRRKGKVVPKVKVESAVVDAVTGKSAPTEATQMESTMVSSLFFLFCFVILEGLVLAGAGFLPEAADMWVQDVLYPTYSPTVVFFLGCSSLYGLWKTGKMPGQGQQQ